MENIFTHWESVINLTRNDIVFEYQNKQYGAYAIRKYYPGRLRNAFFYSVTGMLLILAGPILIQKLFPSVPHISIPKPDGPLYTEPPISFPVETFTQTTKREKKVKSEGTNYKAVDERVKANPNPQADPTPLSQGTETTDAATSASNSNSSVSLPVAPP